MQGPQKMKAKTGRPTKLNAYVQKTICQAISLGATYEIAASCAEIPVNTMYHWLARGRRGDGEIYEAFFKAVKKAEGGGAVACLSKIIKAANDGNWAAAAWILERRHQYIKAYEGPIVMNVEFDGLDLPALIKQASQPIEELKTLDGPVIDLDEE